MKKWLKSASIVLVVALASIGLVACGTAGADGLNGLTGERGPQGDRGEQGIQGAQGAQGIQGERGEVTYVPFGFEGTYTKESKDGTIAAVTSYTYKVNGNAPALGQTAVITLSASNVLAVAKLSGATTQLKVTDTALSYGSTKAVAGALVAVGDLETTAISDATIRDAMIDYTASNTTKKVVAADTVAAGTPYADKYDFKVGTSTDGGTTWAYANKKFSDNVSTKSCLDQGTTPNEGKIQLPTTLTDAKNIGIIKDSTTAAHYSWSIDGSTVTTGLQAKLDALVGKKVDVTVSSDTIAAEVYAISGQSGVTREGTLREAASGLDKVIAIRLDSNGTGTLTVKIDGTIDTAQTLKLNFSVTVSDAVVPVYTLVGSSNVAGITGATAVTITGGLLSVTGGSFAGSYLATIGA